MVVSTETWIRAQESVLGACLIDDRCVIKIVFALTESDFCETYRTIYRAMHDLYTTGKAVDPVTILAVIGPQYKDVMAQLMEITPTAANVEAYVEIVREQSRILQLRQVGLRLNEINDIAEGNEILAAAASQTVKDSDDIWSLSDGLHDWMARYQKTPEYLDWFLPQMRRMLLGEKSDYYILGGRPSSGKSAFAVQAAVYWAVICRKRVGFFSHETSREKIMDRLVACAAGVPLKAMKERTLSDKELEAVCAMTAKINEAPLYTIKAAGKTAAQIRDIALHKHFDIIIVDYLQIVSAKGDTEYARVTEVSMALHIMCQQYGIFCLALSQLSRLKGERPTLEDLRSSGQLEQDADAVLFLHKLNETGEPRELIISKNKDGELGTTKLAFDGSKQQFLYIGRGDKPVKAFDYVNFTYRADEQELEQMEMLPYDTPVPFEH